MILDTDVFIEVLRDDPLALHWITRQPAMPFLSGVAALEASFGSQSATELRLVHAKLKVFHILWPEPKDTEDATRQFSSIKLSHGLGAFDAITAAIAIRHKLQIVTFNVRHFRAIPGVSVIQPYVR